MTSIPLSGIDDPIVARTLRTRARRWGKGLFWLLFAAIIFGISTLPLLYSIDAAFYRETRTGLASDRSLAAFVDVFATREYLGYLAQSLWLSALVTTFSLIIGVGI